MKYSRLLASVSAAQKGKMDPEQFRNEVVPQLRILVDMFLKMATLFEPGSFWGDITTVTARKNSYEAALTRLVQNTYQRSYVFHTNRWYLGFMQNAFARYASGIGHQKAWEALAAPSLLEAAHGISEEMLMPEVPPYLRREVRKGIEHDLLDGLSVEEYVYRYRLEIEIPEEDAPGVREMDDRLLGEFAGYSELRIDFLVCLSRLREEERETLHAEISGVPDEEFAESMGVKPATVRQWRKRGRDKLRTAMGNYAATKPRALNL